MHFSHADTTQNRRQSLLTTSLTCTNECLLCVFYHHTLYHHTHVIWCEFKIKSQNHNQDFFFFGKNNQLEHTIQPKQYIKIDIKRKHNQFFHQFWHHVVHGSYQTIKKKQKEKIQKSKKKKKQKKINKHTKQKAKNQFPIHQQIKKICFHMIININRFVSDIDWFGSNVSALNFQFYS